MPGFWVGFGVFCFGTAVGWFIYFTNRYRTAVAIGDITTLLGAIAGAGIVAFLGKETPAGMVAAYGMGLAFGFFAYFGALILLVRSSGGAYNILWFLDGRRQPLPPGWEIPAETGPTVHPMAPIRPEPQMTPRAAFAAPAPIQDLVSADLNTAINSVVQALSDLETRIGDTLDDGVRQQLLEKQTQLNDQLDRLTAIRLGQILDSQAVRDALATLKAATEQLNARAQEIKTAADAVTKAGAVIDQAVKIVAALLPFL